MGMMGMFKWLRKDVVQRDRNGWNLAAKQYKLNNESYRNALQAFIDRRRFSDDLPALENESPCSPDKRRADFLAKNNSNHGNKKCDNEWKSQQSKPVIPGVPHVRASEIFEIGWIAGTEDRYLELIFAEWQNTRVSLKRHTHPECRDAVKADLDVLSEIRHPNVLLLMATTQTDDHGLVSIFESVSCTLYNFIHEQGERLCIEAIAKCGGKLSDALRHAHMRGYVHGAISSHSVYLTSNGLVKLGGWELAIHVDNARPDREYEERLRAEIFRWQAPEIFNGSEPRKESDVYGLALLIWEMCTMRVPWSGYSRADVERQYVHWKRGVIMDLYDFPPLLNNLLEAGLQLDVTKRTLDMNRMRRFLQRLEMQYEDEEPMYTEQYANNNNETAKTYLVPGSKSPEGAKLKNNRLVKSASIKRLSQSLQTCETPKQYFNSKKVLPKQAIIIKAPGIEPNLFGVTESNNPKTEDAVGKNVNVLSNVQNPEKTINSVALHSSESTDSYYNVDEYSLKLQPWNNTYKKMGGMKQLESDSTTSIYSASSSVLEGSEESFKDARTVLREIKGILADRREHFFYGSDSPSTSSETSPKNRILAQARSTDYEPHKPASHKTSIEPKCNRSPGQYDSSYMKSSFQQYFKIPSKGFADAVAHPQVLRSDSQDFFERSWRKEKLICLSKMRRMNENEETVIADDTLDGASKEKYYTESDSMTSQNTYTIHAETTADRKTGQEVLQEMSQDLRDSQEVENSKGDSLQTLKDALDRATDIVRSVTPNTDDSCPSPSFKSYQTFDVTGDDTQEGKSVFENMYNLKSRDNEEIRSIERSTSHKSTFLLKKNSDYDTSVDVDSTEGTQNTSFLSERPSQISYDATFTRNFTCESIAEASNESNSSSADVGSDAKSQTFTVGNASVHNKETTKTEAKIDIPSKESKSVVTNLTLMLLNDTKHNKNCKSCNHSALPRRRSLPAALSQLRTINNVTLGKLPIRKADMPDNTVEDLYIDDEFGDSLNVNMVLLDEELSLDEDFLPDISEL